MILTFCRNISSQFKMEPYVYDPMKDKQVIRSFLDQVKPKPDLDEATCCRKFLMVCYAFLRVSVIISFFAAIVYWLYWSSTMGELLKP